MLRSDDYDCLVTTVLLAHRFALSPGAPMDGYGSGRKMWGMVCGLSSAGEYCFADGKVQRILPGQVALIPAASAYRVSAAEGVPFEHDTVNFLCEPPSSPGCFSGTHLTVLTPTDSRRMTARFGEMAEDWRRMRPGYRMRARALLTLLLSDFLFEHLTARVDPAAYSRTLPAKRMLEASYAEPVSIAELSQRCGMSESGFRRAFKAVYGESPISYLLKLRIEKAKELLILDLSLDEIARQTGFTDANYLVRYFKKLTGMTPGKYRRLF